MATKYFVLNLTDPHGNIVIGRNHNWSSVYNWASTSGGNDNVGPPGINDDAVIDGNSFDKRGSPGLNAVFIDGDFFTPNVCKNLTVQTGFSWAIDQASSNHTLAVYGQLNLYGVASSAFIKINTDPSSNMSIYLLGSSGVIQGVIAKNIFSFGGNRIYYDNLFSNNTITNSPFWLYPNPPQWSSGKSYIVGDYVSNTTFSHLYVCVANHISGDFATDLFLGFWEVADTSGDPQYLIPNRITVRVTNVAELLQMANAPDYNYLLENDIDLTGVSWIPIGTANFTLSDTDQNPFTGSFNGKNHKISNLTHSDTGELLSQCFFGAVGSGQPFYHNTNAYISPVIKNVTLNNFNISGLQGVAGLIGQLWTGQISNIHINNISLTGNVSMQYGLASLGALIGEAAALDLIPTIIENCTVNGCSITGDTLFEAGGLIGDAFLNTIDSIPSNLTVNNCYVDNVLITDTSGNLSEGGGFIGSAEGSYEECYASGSIVGANSNCGGFFGQADILIINDCYARVNITSSSNGSFGYGGFIGNASAPCAISDCYCSGTLVAAGGNTSLGGFIFEVTTSSVDEFSIINCYSVGKLTTSHAQQSGGFIGLISGSVSNLLSITNCWWYTGAYTVAVGENDIRSTTGETLAAAGYGGDDTDNTHFYTKTHPVYASGVTPVYQTYLKDEAGNVLLDEQGNVLLQQ